MNEEIIKLIAYHTDRAAFWRAHPNCPWNIETMDAMATGSEAVVSKLLSLLPKHPKE